MTLPADYIDLLSELARAFAAYEAETGVWPVLVGGAAAAIQTAGEFMSGDFDVVAANDDAFDKAMRTVGFLADERIGRMSGGYYHPSFPRYGVELVSGPLFDGRADPEKLIRLTINDGSIVLPSIEDLIADRLGQFAVSSASDTSRLEQAKAMLRMAKEVDRHYLKVRIVDEGGDPSLIGL